MPGTPDLTELYIKINGAEAPAELYDNVLRIVVESRLDMPAQAVLEVADPELALIDSTDFDCGRTFVVSMKNLALPDQPATTTELFNGEITALEPDLDATRNVVLRVEATSRAHRMYREVKTRSFVQQTDTDMAAKIAGEHGLSPSTDSTTVVYEHVSQAGQTDYEFLHERARRIGYRMYVDGSKLHFEKPATTAGDGPQLTWGENLLEFRPRIGSASQASEITAQGWDIKEKREISGTARAGAGSPGPAIGQKANKIATAFAGGAFVMTGTPPVSVADAESMAQGTSTELWTGIAEAEGVCQGNPAMLAGKQVEVNGVGTKFSGKYLLSQVRHVRDEDGYRTEFEVRGLRSESFADLVNGGAGTQHAAGSKRWTGVVPGIVTNLQDPEGFARVKVKFPWLDSNYESNWARVAVPMAGGTRGMLFSPEVNDEVLVAFEHGDFNVPYVVGFLWNGKDKPPPATGLAQGQVDERVIVSKAGHKIILREKAGQEAIEIIDKTGRNKVTIDSTSGQITVEGTKLEVTAKDSITMKGMQVNIEATTNMTVKAGAQLNLEGSAQVGVKGGVINLN